jgi:hypothetical protein
MSVNGGQADIESNQWDQIIRPGRDWLRGRGEDRAHEDSSVPPRNKSINNFVARNKSTNRMELIDENQKGSCYVED